MLAGSNVLYQKNSTLTLREGHSTQFFLCMNPEDVSRRSPAPRFESRIFLIDS